MENNIIKVPFSWTTRDEVNLNVIDPGDWVQGNPDLRSIVPAGLKANEKISIHHDLIYTRDEVLMGDQVSKTRSIIFDNTARLCHRNRRSIAQGKNRA